MIQACKNHFGKADNVHVTINPETCDFAVYADRTVVEYVEDPAMEISLTDAQKITSRAEIGGMVQVPVQSKEFGRIATQNAKNVILQKIREEERKVLFDEYYGKEKDFKRNIGKPVEVRTYRPIEKQKEFCGVLTAYDSNSVTIDEDGNERVFDKKDIALIRPAIEF